MRNNEHKLIAINSMPDHVHLLIGLRPAQSLSSLMQDIKSGSSKWINEREFCLPRFQWQEGYGAFSVGTRDVFKVVEYILYQEQHHRKLTFREEYLQVLEENEIAFEEKYIFSELQ